MQAKINCFNTQCGFIQVNKDLPVNKVIEPVSTYGGEQWTETFLIQQVGIILIFPFLLAIIYD